ncbi:hypothetical protein TVAG_249870 [Trichomonas vaginalis G3]|uniref:Importin N-terminal domain-containing protein n=1 Tax=Trichomonas vaginalis (strain ATCC PRA-98 / G3) TaxID=412133 RepID=A2DCJ0_TRIV3|nr:armadillo (ARM) repeat-containing protein family [Trichomonas vaginalis G3]EAY21927.1 hypothetical protein TVAG_249870 [Trichomonas vaginalis G3]KAI5487598.1 armadillo (ARM) repeat-containing protein family [Trichomonas vaginalis G3]|eukprot:XP_001582913.1 hypothetical protein [Trichomonas vaginalis G3]
MSNLLEFSECISLSLDQDNEVRHEAETKSNAFLNEQPAAFLESILQIISDNAYSNYHAKCIAALLSIMKHHNEVFTPEISLGFYQMFSSAFPQLLHLSSIGDLEKNWLCCIFAFIMSVSRQQNPDNNQNYTEYMMNLEKQVPSKFIFTVLSETLECSPDVTIFDINYLYQFLQQHTNETFDAFSLYFSIIGKIEPIQEFLDIFPSILEVLTQSTDLNYMNVVNNFCEKNSPFLPSVFPDLSKIISNKIINTEDEQTIIHGIFIFYSIVHYSSQLVRFSAEFLDIVIDTFMIILNHYDPETDDNDSSTLQSLCLDIAYQISGIIDIEYTSYLFQKLRNFFANNTEEYLYGLMILCSSYHIYYEKHDDLHDALINLLASDDFNIKYAAHRLCSKLIHSADFSSKSDDCFDFFLSELSPETHPAILKYVIIICCAMINADKLEEEQYPVLQQIFLNAFQFVNDEESLCYLIDRFTKIAKSNPQKPSIEDIFGLYNQLLEAYGDNDKIKIQIIRSGTIFINKSKNVGNDEEEIEEDAKTAANLLYNLCIEKITGENSQIDPQNVREYMKLINVLLIYVEDTGETTELMWNQSFETIFTPLDFKAFMRNEYIDLSAYILIDNVPGNFRYAIESSIIGNYVDSLATIQNLCNNQKYFDRFFENDSELLNRFLQTILDLLASKFFVSKIATNCLQTLAFFYKRLYKQNAELSKQILTIFVENIMKLSSRSFQYIHFGTLISCIDNLLLTRSFNMKEVPGFIEACSNLIIQQFIDSLGFIDDYLNRGAGFIDEGSVYTEKSALFEDPSELLFKIIRSDTNNYVRNLIETNLLPKILELIQNEQMMELSPAMLVIYLGTAPDASLFIQYHDVFYSFFQHPPERNEEGEFNPSEKYKYDVMLTSIFKVLFHTLRSIKFTNYPEQGYELFNMMVECYNNTDIMEDPVSLYCSIGAWCLSNFEIYQNNFEAVVDVILSKEFSPVAVIEADNGWIYILLIANWIMKFYDIFEESYQEGYDYYAYAFSFLEYDKLLLNQSLPIVYNAAFESFALALIHKRNAHTRFIEFLDEMKADTYDRYGPTIARNLEYNLTAAIKRLQKRASEQKQ